MADKDSNRGEDRRELERRTQRRVVGVLLLPIALFPLLSLISYNWRDISLLTTPPLSPPANLIGVVGAWSAFIGYSVVGLALWVIPVFVLFFSVMLLYGKIMRMGRRAIWMGLFLLALCGLVQLGSGTVFDSVLGDLNLRPNAGGAVGYWIMTCFLERWFSPFGGGVLMGCIMFFSLLMAVGIRQIFDATGHLLGWLEKRRQEGMAVETGEDLSSADGLPSRERELQRQSSIKEAAAKAKEEARKAREEEKARIRAEKEAERAAKLAAREKERKAREEQRAAAKEAARIAREKAAAERDIMSQQEERERRLRERQAAARAAQLAALVGKTQGETVKHQDPAPVPEPDTQEIPPVQDAIPVVVTKKTEDSSSKAPAPAVEESVRPEDQEYPLPPVDLLDPLPTGTADHGDLDLTAQVLVDTLKDFDVEVEIVGSRPGPVVTQYELKPGPRIKIERIVSLSANLQMALAAKSLRIEAPIPGKQAVGIEVPNKRMMPVTFHEVVMGNAWKNAMKKLAVPLALGKDVAGNDLIYDLARAPHLLVAGSTGSGKSVCLNSIIIGLLMSRTPEQLRLILVDPKRVEFTMYNDLPHLLVPVINDSKKVSFGLRWAIVEMNKRYKLFQKYMCRNIEAYNNRLPQSSSATQGDLFDQNTQMEQAQEDSDDPKTLPYIVIIVDEVADIMASVGKEIEPCISKLCALSRAVGIHLILATQRPSVDVITGTIKSNIPGRIAFKVSQANDSRTILDNTGAEELLGKGDMLFLKEGSMLMRAQGAFVADKEIESIVRFVKEHCKPCYDKTLCGRLDGIHEADGEELLDAGTESAGDANATADTGCSAPDAPAVDSEEPSIQSAIEVIRMTHRASTSMLQRRLSIGYNKAARIMDKLEARGIVGPSQGAGVREILVDLDRDIPSNTSFDAQTSTDPEKEESMAEEQVPSLPEPPSCLESKISL